MTTYLMVPISPFRRYVFGIDDLGYALRFSEYYKTDLLVVKKDEIPVVGWTTWMAGENKPVEI